MISSQHEIKCLVRQIVARELVILLNVREEAVLGVTQILRALGAEMNVTLASSNDEKLFKKWPPHKRRPKSRDVD